MAEITLRDYCELISEKTEQGRYGEAIAHAKHILSQYPKYATAYRLLGETLLEAGQEGHGIEMFQRVLSADPEDLLAWVGLSECYNRQGKLDPAVWYMERAFELASDNRLIEDQLRRLQERRGGVELQRVQLTRGALARLYLKADLLPRAIAELRRLVASHPERVDLRVALAEALWRNEQRLEASESCQQILDELPFCLKANLIMGSIWSGAGRSEANLYLRRAEAVDPENRAAAALFGPSSILPPRDVTVTLLEYQPVAEAERPAWLVSLEETAGIAEQETAVASVPSPFAAQIEIPSWLVELGLEGLGEPSTEEPVAAAEPEAGEEAGPEPAEAEAALDERLAWLTAAGALAAEEGAVEPAQEGIPEWLREIEPTPQPAEELPPPGPVAEEIPSWMAIPEGAAAVPEALPTEAAIETLPEWLAQPEPPEAEEMFPATVEEAPVESAPSWLAGDETGKAEQLPPWLEELSEQLAGGEPTAEGEAQTVWPTFTLPDVGTLGPQPEEMVSAAPSAEAAPIEVAETPTVEAAWPGFAPPEAAPVSEPAVSVEAPAPVTTAEETPVAMPDWLTEGELPSGDEALAWLERLAAGKEEELRAQAIAEGERSYAEIMGRARPAEVPVSPAEPAAVAPTATPPPEEMPEEEVTAEAAPETVEAFGWTTFEAAAAVELAEEAAAEAPAAEELTLPPAFEPSPAEEAVPEPVAEVPVTLPALAEEEIVPSAFEAVPAEAEEEVVQPIAEVAEAQAATVEPIAEALPEVRLGLPVEEVAVAPAAPPVAPVEALPAEEAAPEAREAAEVAVAEPVVAAEQMPTPSDAVAAKRQHVLDHPRDYAAWLELARLLHASGQREEALKAYGRALRGRDLTDSVIEDVEALAAERPDAAAQQLLGDAYMKAGRLQDALRAYRQALQAI